MDKLPSEIVDLLFPYLPIASTKSFRLVCKSFAVIGEDYLFRDYEFRLYPQTRCLDQLEEIIAHHTIAPRLTCLVCESGVQLEWADYRYWKAQVYQAASSDFSRGITSDGISQDEYRRFHTVLEARFGPNMGQRYEQYRDWIDQEAIAMADRNVTARLSKLVSKIHGLKSIKIVMTEPQITLACLEAFPRQHPFKSDGDVLKFLEPRSRVQKRRQNCLQHFIGFLEAVTHLPYKIPDFFAINMPRELLTEVARRHSNILRTVFQNTHFMNLQISEFPHSDWLSRGGQGLIYYHGRNIAAAQLARLLNVSRELTNLTLEFPEGGQAEYSFELFDQTIFDRPPRVWLSGLRTFSLSNFICNWSDLKAFLESAHDVRSLTLRNCRLETGHMTDLIHALRDSGLHDVCINGVWSVQEDEGIWHSHSESDFTDCSFSTSYEGPYAAKGLRYKIETFILSGGACPLPIWSLHGQEEQLWELEGDTSWHYTPWPTR